jgi:uncharacterized membrane protein required for colicin V production
MHALDILFIIAAGYFVVIGIRRGLIGELFRLIGLVAGFLVAFLYYPELAGLFRINPVTLRNAMAFTLIFIAVIFAVIAAGWLLKKAVHLTPLGPVDSLLGGALGGAKAVLIFWVICLSCASLPPSKFVRDAHRSLVFQAYKKLPPAISIQGLMKMRARFKKSGDHAVLQKPTEKNSASTTAGAKNR